MKKILAGIIILSLLVIGFLYREKLNDALFGSNLPEPSTIAFEKQLPLYSYDWRLLGPTGKSLSFIEYMNRTVIVNYWSSKSPESVEELKVWAKLYEDYKNDVFFVFVTKDSQTEVNSFIEETGYVFPVFLSGSTPLKSIVLDKTPKTYLITKQGRIAVNHSGAANWNSEQFRKMLDQIVKK